ncbi:Uncharacterised protein [Bordetella pertussis]|nr:Uncharacterised protein [Bordetella pertussis]
MHVERTIRHLDFHQAVAGLGLSHVELDRRRARLLRGSLVRRRGRLAVGLLGRGGASGQHQRGKSQRVSQFANGQLHDGFLLQFAERLTRRTRWPRRYKKVYRSPRKADSRDCFQM